MAINNSNCNQTRVVVTGIGAMTPLGMDMDTTWQNLLAGKSGIDRITLFDASATDTKIAGEVKGFDALQFIPMKESRRMDRFTHFAVAAGQQAVAKSGIPINTDTHDKIAVIVGSGIGGLTTLYEQTKILLERGPSKVTPFLAPMMISDMAAAQISIQLGIKGMNLCTTTACSSGSDAVGMAYEIIKHGDAEAALAGGAEAIINPIGIAAFNALRALSVRNDEPQKASRPFDIERDGFVVSEGACVLVLEKLEHAKKRGANIIAEIITYGASADAFHVTQPAENGEGAVRAIQMALAKGGLTPDEIDYIKAHGTSTQLNDKTETTAIKTVFGERAYKIPISSPKSMLGHMIGAAGAIEAAVCARVLQEGIIPPTINLTHPDPACDLDYVPNTARKVEVRTALCNSFGFGGHNSVLGFRKYSGG